MVVFTFKSHSSSGRLFVHERYLEISRRAKACDFCGAAAEGKKLQVCSTCRPKAYLGLVSSSFDEV